MATVALDHEEDGDWELQIALHESAAAAQVPNGYQSPPFPDDDEEEDEALRLAKEQSMMISSAAADHDGDDDALLRLAQKQSLLEQQQEEGRKQAAAILERYKEERELNEALEASRSKLHREQLEEEDSEFAMDLQWTEVAVQTEEQELQAAQAAVVLEERQHRQGQERWEGSWECPACTYRNPPYHYKCQACRSEPPSHVLAFCPIVPDLSFGVELELIIPNGQRDGYSCEWVAQQMTQRGGVPTIYQGYTHETTREWKVVTDASLSSSNPTDDLCVELVSPILCGQKGLEAMRHAFESVRTLGISIHESCGFHVHVNAAKATPGPTTTTTDASSTDAINGDSSTAPSLVLGEVSNLKRLAQYFVLLETAFDAIVAGSATSSSPSSSPPPRRRYRRTANYNRYCQSNLLAFGTKSPRQIYEAIQETTSIRQLVHMVSPDRYYKLNLTNLIQPNRPDTIEFRQHGGVQELIQAEAWVRFLLRFCQQATLTNENTSYTGSGGEIASWIQGPPVSTNHNIDRLFQLIQCPGLQGFFTMDRQLYNRYGGSTSCHTTESLEQEETKEWQCRVCRKRFRLSQDLSRHVDATGHAQ